MNEDLIRGRWNDFKGELQKTWGELTGDDLEQVKGNLKSLGGILERRYGYAKERVHQKLNELIADFRRKHKEDEEEQVETAAHVERQRVSDSLKDQFRQF